MIEEILFDMDNTLFLTNIHYDKAMIESLQFMSNYFGNKLPSLEYVLSKQREFDFEFHKKYGYGIKGRFSSSIVKTYEEISKELKISIDETVREVLSEIGEKPFDINCYNGQDLMPGVEETLDFLMQQGCKLKLYTKGTNYQYEKVEFFNLYRWFKKENIFVVSRKTADDLKEKVSEKEKACFVSDSLGDAIVGIKACIKVVHIPLPEIYKDSWDNEGEVPESDLYIRLNNMLEFKANYHSV